MSQRTEIEFAAAHGADAAEIELNHPGIFVTAQVDPSNGRAAWCVRSGGFVAWLPINCSDECRDGKLVRCNKIRCNKIGEFPGNHYGARPPHCHGWHWERVDAFVKTLKRGGVTHAVKRGVGRPAGPTGMNVADAAAMLGMTEAEYAAEFAKARA